MKHSGFALFALLLFFLAVSCKNTTNSGGDASTSDNQTTEGATAPNPASVKKLNAKIEYDLVTQRGISYQNKALSEETLALLINVRPVWYTTTGETKEKLSPIFDKLIGFFTPYQAHKLSTDQLDSLSVHLVAGKISESEAQKQYATIKETMMEEGKKLEEGKAGLDIPALSAEFEGIIKGANIKAGGGR